ncbi:anthranilate synthase component I family protein [Parachlamydia sp. AcF125]|uniref:anthranilate synthase component I family protein n=1 Tax=Parachlamydia sp. AcF125 TaxID=2795736 RepID=UPI001BC9DA69|nr:anthranilate synthase component I family protein [Parachlamydia sp. AcF125]MBS4167870.1 Aminodeoxychorismate synthase component 1 [Parachlamydia sp. AcF125]
MSSFFNALDLSSIIALPEDLLQIARYFSHEKGTCFLYSGGSFPLSKKSFLCLYPFSFICIEPTIQRKSWGGGILKPLELHLKNPWDALKQFLNEPSLTFSFPRWVGYLGYEMGAYSDSQLVLEYTPPEIPLAYFQRFACTIVFDHDLKKCQLWIDQESFSFLDRSQIGQILEWSTISTWIRVKAQAYALASPSEVSSLIFKIQPAGRESYLNQVQKAKTLIEKGEIYQVNLSQPFTLQGRREGFELFYRLAKLNPAPYSGYWDLPFCSIVSSSPEKFLKKDSLLLSTEPIKGTAPRGTTPTEDGGNRERLVRSEKENAELLMITDLMRHDLGKVSVAGSVKVNPHWNCYGYQNVFHLSSEVESIACSSLHFLDIIRACFPGGSITGCPKIRAMQTIHAFEKRARGIYTGSLGYFSHNGDFDFNIAIRSLILSPTSIHTAFGAGIVADSLPDQEYQEILSKGQSIFEILNVSLV